MESTVLTKGRLFQVVCFFITAVNVSFVGVFGYLGLPAHAFCSYLASTAFFALTIMAPTNIFGKAVL